MEDVNLQHSSMPLGGKRRKLLFLLRLSEIWFEEIVIDWFSINWIFMLYLIKIWNLKIIKKSEQVICDVFKQDLNKICTM